MSFKKNRVIQYFFNDTEFSRIFKKSSKSIPIEILGMICSLGIGIFIARSFGPEGVGMLNLSRRIVQFAVLVSLCGAPFYIVKSIAQLVATKRQSEINNFLFSFLFYIVIVSIILTILIISFSNYISIFLGSEKLTEYLSLFALNIIPISILSFFSFAMNGKKMVVWSTFYSKFIGPFITIVLFLIIYFLTVKISLLSTLKLITISNYISCIIAIQFWLKKNPIKKLRLDLNIKKTLAKSYPFFLIGLFNFIYLKVDVFIIEYFLDTVQVGLYSIAFRLGTLLAVVHMVVGRAAGPTIAELVKKNQLRELEKLLQKLSFTFSIIALLCILIFIVFGKKFLGIWGEPFLEAYPSLIFIVAAQGVNMLTGHTGMVLAMGNYEKLIYRISLLFIIVNFILNVILIPYYGILGASITYFIAIASVNIIKVIIVRSKFKINPIKIF